MPRKALIEIHEKEGYLFVDFRGNGLIYKIPRMYEREVFSHINKEIRKYKEMKEKLINEASSLGAIIIFTTVGGEDPHFLSLKMNIEKILKKYAKECYSSLEKYIE